MEAIAILVVWYGIGLGTAWVMSRAGYDPFPWVFAGWLTGAWAALAAIAYVRYDRRRSSRRPEPAASSAVVDLRVPDAVRDRPQDAVLGAPARPTRASRMTVA